jgi:hypothetical protein
LAFPGPTGARDRHYLTYREWRHRSDQKEAAADEFAELIFYLID